MRDEAGHAIGPVPAALVEELAGLRALVERLRAENARLLRLLELTPAQAAAPGPVQTGFFEAPPGPVHAGSPPRVKVAFFGALFAARSDVYAVRWENTRTGKAGSTFRTISASRSSCENTVDLARELPSQGAQVAFRPATRVAASALSSVTAAASPG